MEKFLRKDIADLLTTGLDVNAYGRTELVVLDATFSSKEWSILMQQKGPATETLAELNHTLQISLGFDRNRERVALKLSQRVNRSNWTLTPKLKLFVLEELNVKSIVPCNDPLKYASLRAEPEFSVFGKRLGKSMPVVAKEVKAMSQEDILAFEKSGEITVAAHSLKLTDIKVHRDVVLDLSSMANQTIKLGGGLHQNCNAISVTKARKLRFVKPNKYWVESSQKRYVPCVGDNVLGIVVDSKADNFLVDIKGPALVFLPILSFEGGTRRNISKFEVGTLIDVRVVKANTGMNPKLSCTDATGKATGYGSLKDGFTFESSTGLARMTFLYFAIVLLNPRWNAKVITSVAGGFLTKAHVLLKQKNLEKEEAVLIMNGQIREERQEKTEKLLEGSQGASDSRMSQMLPDSEDVNQLVGDRLHGMSNGVTSLASLFRESMLSIVMLLSRPQQVQLIPQPDYMSTMCSLSERMPETMAWVEKRIDHLKDEMHMIETLLEKMQHKHTFLKAQLKDLEYFRRQQR
ncbi:hypothetical protein ACSBR1_008565 [Camellia fascicularis]